MENLASKYRPRKFEEVVAQGYVKDILLSQLQKKETKNAYLFTGGAGTGKTTTARIFAADINDGRGRPIEIDAASNNGVDNIRDIIEDSKFKSMDSEYKVYIIDEVHMLSTGAFNALLKTLEEPPSGTVFVLCTTDPQKIPATILSRVQRFDFTRIETELIVERLSYIIDSENGKQFDNQGNEWVRKGAITYEDEALEFIAKLANGGMRDSITRLEKVLDYSNEVTVENVTDALGVPDYETFIHLAEAVVKNSPKDALSIIDDFHMRGKDLKLTMRNFADFILDVCKYFLLKDMTMTQMPPHIEEKVDELISVTSYDVLLWMMEELNSMNSVIKWEPNAKPIIESQLLLMAKEED